MFVTDDLQILLERTGGTLHTVDGAELFCRVKGLAVAPDDFGRLLVERQELAYIADATFKRSAHHDVVVDGATWSIIGVREKLSGLVVWTLEREVA